MRLQKLALALLCGSMIAAPAFAQSTTTTAKPVAPATTATVPATPAPVAKPATPPATAATTPPATTAPAATTATTAPVGALTNINTASAKDLDKLPLIGKARAASIIKNRPYKTTDELLSKKAIPANVYEKIKDKVTVG